MVIELILSRYDRRDCESMTVEPGWNWSWPEAPSDWIGPISGSASTIEALAADIRGIFGEVA